MFHIFLFRNYLSHSKIILAFLSFLNERRTAKGVCRFQTWPRAPHTFFHDLLSLLQYKGNTYYPDQLGSYWGRWQCPQNLMPSMILTLAPNHPLQTVTFPLYPNQCSRHVTWVCLQSSKSLTYLSLRLAVWFWTNEMNILCLSFLIHKVRRAAPSLVRELNSTHKHTKQVWTCGLNIPSKTHIET